MCVASLWPALQFLPDCTLVCTPGQDHKAPHSLLTTLFLDPSHLILLGCPSPQHHRKALFYKGPYRVWLDNKVTLFTMMLFCNYQVMMHKKSTYKYLDNGKFPFIIDSYYF